jgi:transposase
MPNLPLVTATEWKLIAPLLPPAVGRPGKPRQDDRRYVSAFFYAEATRCSLDALPLAYGNARSLRTRRQRWEADGTMAKLMQAGEPVVQRMRRTYWDLIRNATLNWQNSGEFFGRGVIPRQPHLQPKGRYADRRR